jgi:hypothetical protein
VKQLVKEAFEKQYRLELIKHGRKEGFIKEDASSR